MSDEPLAILVEAIEREVLVAGFIFANPSRTLSAADGAHSIQGFAGGSRRQPHSLDAVAAQLGVYGCYNGV